MEKDKVIDFYEVVEEESKKESYENGMERIKEEIKDELNFNSQDNNIDENDNIENIKNTSNIENIGDTEDIYGGNISPTLGRKKVPYPRDKKFRTSKEIINYIAKFYYKKYSLREGLPNYLVRQIIFYKISNFKFLATRMESKEFLGPSDKQGTMLWFNKIIISEKALHKELKRILEKEDIKEREDRRSIEKDFLAIEDLIDAARNGYAESKRMYKRAKMHEENEFI